MSFVWLSPMSFLQVQVGLGADHQSHRVVMLVVCNTKSCISKHWPQQQQHLWCTTSSCCKSTARATQCYFLKCASVVLQFSFHFVDPPVEGSQKVSCPANHSSFFLCHRSVALRKGNCQKGNSRHGSNAINICTRILC